MPPEKRVDPSATIVCAREIEKIPDYATEQAKKAEN